MSEASFSAATQVLNIPLKSDWHFIVPKMQVVETLLEAWVVGTVSHVEDGGHVSGCLCLHLLKQRLKIYPLGLPELDLLQRPGVVPVLKHLGAVLGQNLLDLWKDYDDDMSLDMMQVHCDSPGAPT